MEIHKDERDMAVLEWPAIDSVLEDIEVEYCILTACTATTLEAFVNDHLRDGWKLQGGVSHCQTGDGGLNEVWSQAMVKQVDHDCPLDN